MHPKCPSYVQTWQTLSTDIDQDIDTLGTSVQPRGWLRMYIVLLPPFSQLALNKPSNVYLCAKMKVSCA